MVFVAQPLAKYFEKTGLASVMLYCTYRRYGSAAVKAFTPPPRTQQVRFVPCACPQHSTGLFNPRCIKRVISLLFSFGLNCAETLSGNSERHVRPLSANDTLSSANNHTVEMQKRCLNFGGRNQTLLVGIIEMMQLIMLTKKQNHCKEAQILGK